jgi:hypothetical protein
MRGVSVLGPTLTVLVLFGACLGTKSGREGCACGPERSSAAEQAEAASSASAPHDSPPSSAAGPAPGETGATLALPDLTGPSWTRVTSRAGKYQVCWRSLSGPVPRNEDFELEAWVLRDGAPVRDAELAVSAWMPAHGHGMLRRARVVPRADGSFRVDGMLLHMRGLWELRFDVLEGTLSEAASCEIEL